MQVHRVKRTLDRTSDGQIISMAYWLILMHMRSWPRSESHKMKDPNWDISTCSVLSHQHHFLFPICCSFDTTVNTLHLQLVFTRFPPLSHLSILPLLLLRISLLSPFCCWSLASRSLTAVSYSVNCLVSVNHSELARYEYISMNSTE